MVAGDRQDLGAGGRQRFEQPMNLLAERGARLLLRPAAPQQLGQPAAQRRARRRQRDHGEQRAGLAARRQHVFAGDRPGLHLADQPQANDDRPGWRQACDLALRRCAAPAVITSYVRNAIAEAVRAGLVQRDGYRGA